MSDAVHAGEGRTERAGMNWGSAAEGETTGLGRRGAVRRCRRKGGCRLELGLYLDGRRRTNRGSKLRGSGRGTS